MVIKIFKFMKVNSIKFLTVAFLISFLFSCTKDDGKTEIKKYEVGDQGPAGGVVFYVKTSKTDGWQYIEVAQEDIEGSEWGCFDSPVSNARISDIGMGKENTKAIVDLHDGFDNYYENPSVCSNVSNGSVAAKLCLDYVNGGADDWFLPSENEMKLIYENVHLTGLGNFTTGGVNETILYWTSTEHDDNTAVTEDFSTGDRGYLCKQCDFGGTKIRAVRYF
jgi:hypothetical protein